MFSCRAIGPRGGFGARAAEGGDRAVVTFSRCGPSVARRRPSSSEAVNMPGNIEPGAKLNVTCYRYKIEDCLATLRGDSVLSLGCIGLAVIARAFTLVFLPGGNQEQAHHRPEGGARAAVRAPPFAAAGRRRRQRAPRRRTRDCRAGVCVQGERGDEGVAASGGLLAFRVRGGPGSLHLTRACPAKRRPFQ